MNELLNPFNFLLACFGAYRLSRLLTIEDGPFELAYNLRIKTGIEYNDKNEVIAFPPWNPLYCIWCTSVYVAPIVFISWYYASAFWIILAISAVVGLIHSIVGE